MTTEEPTPSVKLQHVFDELSLRYFDGKVSASLYVGLPASVHDKERERLSQRIESLGYGTPIPFGRYVPQRHRIYINPLLTEADQEVPLRVQILHEMCHAF